MIDNVSMKQLLSLLLAIMLSCGADGGDTDGQDQSTFDVQPDTAFDATGDDQVVSDTPDVPTDPLSTDDGAQVELPSFDLLTDEGIPLDLPAEDITIPPPPRPRITVNGIDDTMNGKEPFVQDDGPGQAFRIRVPTGGFTVDVYQRPGEPWDGPVRIEASSPMHLADQDVPVGSDLVPWLACTSDPDPLLGPTDDDLHTRCRLPADALAPVGELQLVGRFEGEEAGPGPEDTITMKVVSLPPHLDPFAATDTWLVVLSRDLFAPELVPVADGTYDIVPGYVPEGNGLPDLDEALIILGLLSDNAEFSNAARDLFVKRFRSYANTMFGLDPTGQPTEHGVNLALVFEGDPDAPAQDAWSPDDGFSMIAVGSDPNDAGIANHIVGMAAIDWNNQKVENNAQYNRGVFVTSIVRQVLNNALGALVVQEISPLDGTPLGLYPGDELFLDPGFDPNTVEDDRLALRFTLYDTIMNFATLAVAATLCHEVGHSLGLVPSGPPPKGLFAGMSGLSFTESDPGSAHIDTPGLNVMQTGKVTSYLEVFDGLPRFNALNLAYLRRQLVVGEL